MKREESVNEIPISLTLNVRYASARFLILWLEIRSVVIPITSRCNRADKRKIFIERIWKLELVARICIRARAFVRRTSHSISRSNCELSYLVFDTGSFDANPTRRRRRRGFTNSQITRRYNSLREFTVAAYRAILGVRERPSKHEAKMEARTYGN